MKDLIEAIFTAVVVIGTVGSLAILIANSFEKYSCETYEEITGRQTKHRFFGGCFVETDSGWLTIAEYGQVIVAREGVL